MFKKMRLRAKMTLWYTLLTVLTVTVFSFMLYLTVAAVFLNLQKEDAALSLRQLTALIENEDGMLTFEKEVPTPAGNMYYIIEENGSEVASFGEDITLLNDYPVEPGVYRVVRSGESEWLLLDSDAVSVDDAFTVRVRVAASRVQGNRVLRTLRLIFLVGIPLCALAAWLIGARIAGRALRPIREIVLSARRITEGDLSARIPPAPAKDELGEMTDTLNDMLSSVQTAFEREKRFTSDASHELRTPVAVARAYTESLLTEPELTDENRAALSTILSECERMRRIIEQLLTITRGQEGRYPMNREPLSLSEVCLGVADTLADKLKQKNIALTIDVPEALSLCADQSLMTELLLNLVENAAKYGRQDGHVALSAQEKDGQILLSVQDDGIGIPAECLPHIFERFYRVDSARDRTGTGLGLSICDWIVRAHGGTITAQSKLNAGTTFLVALPATKEE